jgi:hypothetical protein
MYGSSGPGVAGLKVQDRLQTGRTLDTLRRGWSGHPIRRGDGGSCSASIWAGRRAGKYRRHRNNY